MNTHLCIAPDVKLGENVKLSQFINLYGCEVGDNTKIGAFVEIQKNATVGNNCKISSHTFICEGVTIEDDVFIGHGVTFINDIYPRATASGGGLADREGLESGAHADPARGIDRVRRHHPGECHDRRERHGGSRERGDPGCAGECDCRRQSGAGAEKHVESQNGGIDP